MDKSFAGVGCAWSNGHVGKFTPINVRTWLGIATVSRRRHRAKDFRFCFSTTNIVESFPFSLLASLCLPFFGKKMFFQFFYNCIFLEKGIFLRKFKTLFATFVNYLEILYIHSHARDYVLNVNVKFWTLKKMNTQFIIKNYKDNLSFSFSL